MTGARGGFWRGIALLVALWLAAPTPPALAQTQGAGPEGILVLNQDALYSRSEFGRRVQRELEAAGDALTSENRQIEAQLTDEELRLTEQRATMTPEDFRLLADEFDTRVGEIRQAQDAKARALSAQAEDARQQFFELVFPILLDIVQDRGAAVIVDSRSVLLSAESVDITEAALERVNARLGPGPDSLFDMPQSPPGEGAPPAPAPGP